MVLVWDNGCEEQTLFLFFVHILGFYICAMGLSVVKHCNFQGLLIEKVFYYLHFHSTFGL